MGGRTTNEPFRCTYPRLSKSLKSFVLGCTKNLLQNSPMKIGYARVSTDEQNLDLQTDALKAAGCERLFQDRGISGATSERDGLSQALATLAQGDVLVVWRLDRLGRSLSFLIDLMERLKEQGIGFQSLSDGIDTTTAGGRLVFHIMGALAEFERALIQERTREGLRAAKRRGKRLGRPNALSLDQIAHARVQTEAGEQSIKSMAAILGVGRNTLSRALGQNQTGASRRADI